MVEEGRGPKVQKSKSPKVSGSKGPKVSGSQGLWVQRSKGPEDQDISNSNSDTSLTLKKVHLVINSKGMDLFRDCLTNINAHIWKLETFLRQILLKTLPNWNHKHIGKIMEIIILHSICFTKIVY